MSSAKTLEIKRCLNCGISVKKIEKFLNIEMPKLKVIVENILTAWIVKIMKHVAIIPGKDLVQKG